jgi:hypothetical protein
MGIGFELAASVNPTSTVSATIQLRLRDFSEDEFLLVLSQPIGFHPNRLQIRSQQRRKPIVSCPLFDHGLLFSSSPIPRNAAILLVGNIGGSFGWERCIIFGKKVGLDLPLGLGKVHGKFGDASYYRDRMHSEQTNKQTNFLLYI